ncbi:MAG: FG-GAP-like repeat-containing protein [Bacteroidota bacterium]
MKKGHLIAIYLLLSSFLKAQTHPLCFNVLNSATTFSVGLSPRATCSADFNGDGNADLVTANYYSNDVSVLLGNGTGTFSNAVNYSVGVYPTAITSADVNGDGLSDLAVVNYFSNDVSILLGVGSGSFSAAINYSVGFNPRSITSADFNADGKSDLAIANFGSNNVSVLLGSSSGIFAPAINYFIGSSPVSIISDDFNGDGKADLATANSVNNITVLLGTGSGSMGGALNTITSLPGSALISGDFNGDGNKDLAVGVGGLSTNLIVLQGNGMGSFSSPTSYSVGTGPVTIITADFDGDAILDLVIANSTSKDIFVLKGNGTGAFTVSESYYIDAQLYSISSADLNGDGALDLVMTTNASNNISVSLGTGAGTFYAAINYDFGGTDIALRLVSKDFNNDGYLDFAVATNSDRLRVMLGSSLGTYTTIAANYNIFSQASALTSDDFNNDGNPDVAVAFQSSSVVAILLGSGTGTFSSPVDFTGGSNIQNIVCADFNNDGNKDIATANYNSNNVSILFGDGFGSFAMPVHYSVGINPYRIVAADFNNDNNTDIIVSNISSNTSSILLGSASGVLSTSANISGSTGGASLNTADYNNDGNADFALSDNALHCVSVFIGTGLGSFLPRVNYPVYYLYGSEYLTSNDFNGDGKIDLAFMSDSLSVLVGNGNGTFVPIRKLNAGAGQLISGDFNSDGKIDIAGTNSAHHITLMLNGAPTLTLSSANTVCLGNNITIKALGANTYSWSNGTTTSTLGDSPTANTTYTVIGTTLDGCSDTAMKTITVNALPIPTITVNSGTICNGSSYTLVPSGGITYTYSSGSSVISPSVNTTYTVNGSNAFGCYGTAISSMTVSPLPILTVNSGSICIGDSYTFTPMGAVSYTYSSLSSVITPSGTSTYIITGEDANGCYGATTSSVTVNLPAVLSVTGGTICSGQSFTITPGGALFYTYSSGPIVSPTVTSTYTVNGDNLNGCADDTATVIVSVNPSPTLTSSLSNSTCINSSIDIAAYGASSYLWSNGAITPSINVTPTVSTVYSVTGTDPNNCSNTLTINITVDPTCTDVWPGDANSDGVADIIDILEIGLNYLQTGPARAAINNAWQSCFANNWSGTITNGKNLNHADCNGDGTIDINDTLALFNNYGLTHGFKPMQTYTVNPQLTIVPDQAAVLKGTWGTASIYLGNATNQINNINGLAFTIDFDHTLIETSNIYIEYQNSFLDAGQNLRFRKLDFANGKIYTATTHTVSNNVSGNGKIATLHYQIKPSLTSAQVLNLGILQANQSDAFGIISTLTSGTGSLTTTIDVGLQQLLNNNVISISPNPTNGAIVINSKTELQKIEVVSITGQVLLIETPTNTSHTLHLENFTNGIYFVNVYQTDRIVKREKIVLNK